LGVQEILDEIIPPLNRTRTIRRFDTKTPLAGDDLAMAVGLSPRVRHEFRLSRLSSDFSLDNLF
jgi:hypothetical protein